METLTSRIISALLTAAPDVTWAHCLGVPANANRELCGEQRGYRQRERVEIAGPERPLVFGAALGVGDKRHDR